jgi:hypothetical protein
MSEVLYANQRVHTWALDQAIRAQLEEATFGGVSTGGYGLRVHFVGTPTAEQQAMVDGIIAAHDPVFLDVDRAVITADGVDTVAVIVRTLKPNATAVTLLINNVEQAVELVNGVGTVEVASEDPQTIQVSVKNPANRTTDMISIQAV